MTEATEATEKLNRYAEMTGQGDTYTVEAFSCGVLVKFPATDDVAMQTGVGVTYEEAVDELLRKFGGER